ncbi:hypothetical protein [Paenibacillus glacialis]|uniref:56B-like ribbon-helix-helix domain-containing protein n=1 Tax=Paenibacillus glacialis TaxID=494026 RepID=A0A168KHG3_9BACL|nr:hypothetical protein [Paenibacillus glacialis]OAB42017.1 hypothetical protein PGLA_14465 [Paenibacillus glacialis]
MSSKMEKIKGLIDRKQYTNTNLQETVNTVIHKDGKEETKSSISPKKKATYELDLDLHTELKIFAAKQNKKMVDIVEIALREYLYSHE